MKRFKVVVNGTPYEVDVEEIASGAAVHSAPKTESTTVAAASAAAAPAHTTVSTPATASDLSKESPAAKTADSSQAGPGAIVAPMPGVIVTIKVKPGQEVKRRDVLLTLEAMKMENEILAPRDGRVKAIFVQPGQSVNPQEPLVDLE